MHIIFFYQATTKHRYAILTQDKDNASHHDNNYFLKSFLFKNILK